MEMMNIDAAIRMLDNYSIFLEGQRKMVLQHISNTDPEISAHVTSLRENFEKKLKDAMIDAIVLQEEIPRQTPVLLNFPAELARLVNSLTAFDLAAKESHKALLQTNPKEAKEP
jgi:hypothetical protein